MTSHPPLSTKRWFHDHPLIECDDRQRLRIVFQTSRKYANSYFPYLLYKAFTVSFAKYVPHLCNRFFVKRKHLTYNQTEFAILGWYIYKRSSDKLLRRIHLKQHSLKALHGCFELQKLHQSN